MIRLDRYNNRDFARGASRPVELLWWIVRGLFFFSAFPLPSGVKVWWLRRFGAEIGEGAVIRSGVNITFPWRFACGDHVWIGDEVTILSLDRVSLGSHVCVSQRAFLCTGSHDFSQETFDLQTAAIEVADGCWIGAQAFVGPGVRFAPGSRCLAGAVVVKNVDEEQTVAGVPAKALGSEGKC